MNVLSNSDICTNLKKKAKNHSDWKHGLDTFINPRCTYCREDYSLIKALAGSVMFICKMFPPSVTWVQSFKIHHELLNGKI